MFKALYSVLNTCHFLKIFKITTCFGLNWPPSSVNSCFLRRLLLFYSVMLVRPFVFCVCLFLSIQEIVKARSESSTAVSNIVSCSDNISGMLQIPDYRNAVIVARNPGSAKKATSYAERLRLGIAVIHGEQKEAESDMVDGRYSPPTLSRSRTMDASVGVPVHPAKEKPPINVVGDVGGRIAIMVVSWQLLSVHALFVSLTNSRLHMCKELTWE
jgi:hypothetical protein